MPCDRTVGTGQNVPMPGYIWRACTAPSDRAYLSAPEDSVGVEVPRAEL